jgi:hypothetical protein
MGENNEHTCEMIKYFGYYFPFAKMVEISTKPAFEFSQSSSTPIVGYSS